MVINREEKDGVVECLYNSSNILKSEYNQSKNSLTVVFKSGLQYEYYNVLYRDYLRLEISESTGAVFNKMFGVKSKRQYEYKKLDKVDPTELIEKVKTIIT
jgi:hypothetical protein